MVNLLDTTGMCNP